MIKVASEDELNRIKHLPSNTQKSIQRIFAEIESLANNSLKNTVVLVIEAKEELADIKELGLKDKCSIPVFTPIMFRSEEQQYVFLSMRLLNGTQLIFYIPIEYVQN